MKIAIPDFFCLPVAQDIFFHSFTFSLFVSLGLKWVSRRQHIYGSCFCIPSASLCILVGALEPIIQREVSQKEKHQYSIPMHIYGIQKDGKDNPVCKTAKETQMYRTVFWTLWERARVG